MTPTASSRGRVTNCSTVSGAASWILGLDREGGVGEVREQVNGQILDCQQTEGGHREGGHEHGDRTVDGEAGEHRLGPVRAGGPDNHQPACASPDGVARAPSSITRTVAPSERAGAPTITIRSPGSMVISAVCGGGDFDAV